MSGGGAQSRDGAGFHERLVAAAGASVVSAVVCNPFDVVKTRLQAQASGTTLLHNSSTLYDATLASSGRGGPCRHSTIPEVFLRSPSLVLPRFLIDVKIRWSDRRWAITCCPSQTCSQSSTCALEVCNNRYNSMWDAFRKIVRQEGAQVLWRGTRTSLMMSVPMVGIYMPIYDYMVQEGSPHMGVATPLVAGALSRTVAVFCVGPLELMRTRAYATRASTQSNLPIVPARNGLGAIPRMWTGVTATLARDVPFSALYWGMVEPLRYMLTVGPKKEVQDSLEVLSVNMMAGAMAGGAAAAVTTPLDVVKTRHQLRDSALGRSPSVYHTLRQVYAQEGLSGLFTGLGPRSARAAPACAIVISCYELFKNELAKRGIWTPVHPEAVPLTEMGV